MQACRLSTNLAFRFRYNFSWSDQGRRHARDILRASWRQLKVSTFIAAPLFDALKLEVEDEMSSNNNDYAAGKNSIDLQRPHCMRQRRD